VGGDICSGFSQNQSYFGLVPILVKQIIPESKHDVRAGGVNKAFGRGVWWERPARTPYVSSLYVQMTVHGRIMSTYERRRIELFNGNIIRDALELEEGRAWRGGAANILTKRHSKATILHGKLLAIIETGGRTILGKCFVW